MILQRIEAAIARLEAVAKQPRRGPSVPDAAPELARLAARNARLCEAVSASLRQIDAMIAQQNADSQP